MNDLDFLVKEIGKQKHIINTGVESTDLALMVDAPSREESHPWDMTRIVSALVTEAGVDPNTAMSIAAEVEEEILRPWRTRVTTSLIREMVNVKLFQRGLDARIADHSRIGIPLYDLELVMRAPNKENSNTSHNPESINLTIAETVLKEYALTKVFSPDVARAHLNGDLHLHDLGMINRPYCSGQSPAYVAKFGLSLPSITRRLFAGQTRRCIVGAPPEDDVRPPEQLRRCHRLGRRKPLLCPYLTGLSDKEIHQLAQMLIFEFNQLAGGRGGQVAFTDINLYYEVPRHFRDVPAIGPGGKFTGRTYGEYAEESKRFLRALFEVYLEGDSRGQPFFFPKPLLHITDAFFEEPGWEEMLAFASLVAAEKGNTYFVFDRGGVAKLSECCRLSFELTPEDLLEAKTPWKMRYSALQNVTINLPRLAYRSFKTWISFSMGWMAY